MRFRTPWIRADENDEFFPYELEVSSPGATRALTERRHWERARTRLIAVTAPDGTEYLARLHEVQDEVRCWLVRRTRRRVRRSRTTSRACFRGKIFASAHVEIDFNSPAEPVE